MSQLTGGVMSSVRIILFIVLFFTAQQTMHMALRAQTLKAKPLTNQDVLDLEADGLATEIIIAKIDGSACDFDTSVEAIRLLKRAKVPSAVILKMVQAPVRPQT